MGSEENVFKCAISVAPPTDWLFYDTVYTERYMGLPEASDNLVGYENSSLLSKSEHLRGKNFMINHGVAGKNPKISLENAFYITWLPKRKLVFQMTMSIISIPCC